MSDDTKFQTAVDFDENEKTDANQEIIERVTKVLFVLFMPDNKSMSDNEIEELLAECFDIGSVLMAVMGMRVIGENISGDYVTRFNPYKSLNHFAEENGVA